MKKFTAIALALILIVGAFAACGGSSNKTTYEGTLADLTTKLYEAQPVEFPVLDATPVELDNADSVKRYLGLDSAEGIAEATFSESMMGSQAYSLVLVKVSDTTKIEELKNAMFEGINPAKWICVEADQVKVVSSADLIMLIMVNSELGETIADGMVEGFKTNVGELSGELLSK